MSNIASLLSVDNQKQLTRNKMVESIYSQIISSYEFHPNTRRNHYINNDKATIYFNGNTRLRIEGDQLTLTGFGLRNCPGATLSKVSGCGDEGSITGDLKFIVNALATYEKIYPR